VLFVFAVDDVAAQAPGGDERCVRSDVTSALKKLVRGKVRAQPGNATWGPTLRSQEYATERFQQKPVRGD
jgi:hypothetical protein